MKKRNLQLFFSIPILFLIIVTAQAAEKRKGFLRLGNVEIVPNLTISAILDDNVFSEADLGDKDLDGVDDPDENTDDDFIYSLIPSVNVLYPGENFAFELGYKVDIRKYSDFGDEDHEHQDLKLKMDFLTPSQRYKFTIGTRVRNTSDPASSDRQSEQRLFNAERDETSIYGAINLLVGRAATFIFKITRDANEYDNTGLEAENTENTIFSVTYLHKFWEKTSAVFSYEFDQLEYSDNIDIVFDPDGPGVGVDPRTVPLNSDSSTHSFAVGLDWDPSAKISGRATVGFESRSYDESEFLGDDESTFSLGTSLVWKAREKTKVNFSLRRSLEDSAFDNAAFVTATSFGLGVTQNIGRKMIGEINGVYALNDYDDNAEGLSQRTDDKITIKASLKYNIKDWLYGKLAFQHQNNTSDLDDREYSINEIIVSLGTQF